MASTVIYWPVSKSNIYFARTTFLEKEPQHRQYRGPQLGDDAHDFHEDGLVFHLHGGE